MAPLYTLLQKKGMVIQQEEIELAGGRQGEKRQKVNGPAAMSSEWVADVQQPTMSADQKRSYTHKILGGWENCIECMRLMRCPQAPWVVARE